MEKVELEDIKELLKNYKFEEIDLFKDLGLGKGSKKYSYTFSNDKNEKFSISIKRIENDKVENIESINYIIEKDKSTDGSLPIMHLSYDNYENCYH